MIEVIDLQNKIIKVQSDLIYDLSEQVLMHLSEDEYKTLVGRRYDDIKRLQQLIQQSLNKGDVDTFK